MYQGKENLRKKTMKLINRVRIKFSQYLDGLSLMEIRVTRLFVSDAKYFVSTISVCKQGNNSQLALFRLPQVSKGT